MRRIMTRRTKAATVAAMRFVFRERSPATAVTGVIVIAIALALDLR